MAANVGLVIVKRFDYRGDPNEEWSNKYWFTGTEPPLPTDWKELADQLIAAEKAVYSAQTRVTRAYGYDDNAPDANSVWSYDYGLAGEEVAGTLGLGTDVRMAGDQAGTFWFKLSRKTTRGKWIYLRKFMHDGGMDPQDTDSLGLTTRAAYDTFATFLVSGSLDGRLLQSQAGSESIQLRGSSPWVTTRTLKRRGKRPLATQ